MSTPPFTDSGTASLQASRLGVSASFRLFPAIHSYPESHRLTASLSHARLTSAASARTIGPRFRVATALRAFHRLALLRPPAEASAMGRPRRWKIYPLSRRGGERDTWPLASA